MFVNFKEFYTILQFKNSKIFAKFTSTVNDTIFIKNLLENQTLQQKLNFIELLRLNVLNWLIDVLKTPLGIFTFWYGLFSAIIIYLFNSISKIYISLPSLFDLFSWTIESPLLNAKHKTTFFQLLNVYKEVLFLRLAAINVFFEFIYNYFSFMYIQIFQFINGNLLINLTFDWQQKMVNISNAVSKWATFRVWSDHEQQFLLYHSDSFLFKKGFADMQHVMNTMVKVIVTSLKNNQEQITNILATKGMMASLYSDWLKIATMSLNQLVGLFGFNNPYNIVPTFSMELYPRFYDLKLGQIDLNMPDQSIYMFSLLQKAYLKIYDVKFLNIETDLKMLFEFLLFQSVFCLLSYYYFQILFKQRQFPNPFLPFYICFI